jgi:transposase-like protein
MSEVRAVPFYCPFCGEQELRPGDPSGWRCTSCERRFELKVTGVGSPDAPSEGGDPA